MTPHEFPASAPSGVALRPHRQECTPREDWGWYISGQFLECAAGPAESGNAGQVFSGVAYFMRSLTPMGAGAACEALNTTHCQ